MNPIDFGKNVDEIEQIPEVLNKYLDNVARSGDIIYKWEQFKPLIKKKIQLVVADFNEHHPCDPKLSQPNVKPFDFEDVKRNILNGIDSFSGAPFTIQRICELLTNPYKHYKRADKFMKGLEKNVMVISEETVDQKTENGNDSNNSICLNSTFTLPSTSDSINNQMTAFHNGYKENQTDDHQILSQQQTTTSTIQQLDSFTTVFVSSSQTSTSTHLDRIANLPILESTNHNSSQLPTCLASSSSITITPIDAPILIDPALDNLEKMTTELPIVEPTVTPQQQLTTDIIIETVNSAEEQISLNINSLERSNDKIVLVQEFEGEDKCTNEENRTEGLKTINNISIEEVKDEDELNEQEKNGLNKDESNSEISINVSSEEEQKEEQKEEKLEITKLSESVPSDTFESSINEQESSDLKRTHEDSEDMDESFKRFKSDNESEKSIDEMTFEQSSGDNLINENELDESKSDSEIESKLESEIMSKTESETKEKAELEEQNEKVFLIHHSNLIQEPIDSEKVTNNQLTESNEQTELLINKTEELVNDKMIDKLKSETNSNDNQEKTIDTN